MRAETVFTLLYFIVIVKTAEIANTACFANHEIRYFCDLKIYANAKKSCEDDDSSLVKIDNANMTEVVNALIDNAKCRYLEDVYIGASATPHPNFPKDGSKRIWKWLDGSMLSLPGESGYQNWQNGQPNDVRGREDCMILDKWTKEWKDTLCDEAKYFICQKKARLNLNIKAVQNAMKCLVTAGLCSTHTEWRRGSAIVSDKSNLPVYQTISNNSSMLHYKNATIGDAGEYICVAWVENDKENSKNTSINISVNGTPVIDELKSYLCNTSLQVTWNPHFRALGYQHRIKAFESLTGQLVKNVMITPYKEIKYFTEIAGLKKFTEYDVKAVACKGINICTDEYTAMKSATTLGKVVTVTNATIQQYNGICNVTWQRQSSHTGSFKITTRSTSQDSPNGSISEQTFSLENNIYWFQPVSNQEYTVEIELVTIETYCSIPVKAVGLCAGRDSPAVSGQTLIAPVVILSIIVFITSLVIVSMAILRKRSTKLVEQTQTKGPGNVHDYATVGTPEINGADYLDLTDNSAAQINIETSAGKVSYENIDQSLSPTYETVNNKPVSEYEM